MEAVARDTRRQRLLDWWFLEVQPECFRRADRAGRCPSVKAYLRKFEHSAVLELVGRVVHLLLRPLHKTTHVDVFFLPPQQNAFELVGRYFFSRLFLRVFVEVFSRQMFATNCAILALLLLKSDMGV